MRQSTPHPRRTTPASIEFYPPARTEAPAWLRHAARLITAETALTLWHGSDRGDERAFYAAVAAFHLGYRLDNLDMAERHYQTLNKVTA